MGKRVVVTGGGGFIGAYLVKRLVHDGWDVAVVDTMVRGDASRFAEVADDVELFSCDVRDEQPSSARSPAPRWSCTWRRSTAPRTSTSGPSSSSTSVCAGRWPSSTPGARVGVPDLVVASTAEVYQTPAIVPTPETIPLTLPDSLNPRYSYGGSKIVSELIAFNYAQDHYRQVQVFRPHNVYGPDMGWKHVIPQFILRAAEGRDTNADGRCRSSIQGDGSETRAFCFVDDIVSGLLTMYENGGHREIYHIGNDEEVTIRDLAERVGKGLGVELDIRSEEAAVGGTPRRCPDISKMRGLGYEPTVSLDEGLQRTVEWYLEHRNDTVGNELM